MNLYQKKLIIIKKILLIKILKKIIEKTLNNDKEIIENKYTI